jgi:hypothetical protein
MVLTRAAAINPHNEESDIAPSCLCFINSNNGGMAQFELTHQFASFRIDDVGFAVETVRALLVGDFKFENLSTPSNLTVLPFRILVHALEGVVGPPFPRPLQDSFLLEHLFVETFLDQHGKVLGLVGAESLAGRDEMMFYYILPLCDLGDVSFHSSWCGGY